MGREKLNLVQELPEGTVTVLFTDVVGSTELKNRLGDEPAREVLGASDQLVRDQIARHRGGEVKGTGEGLMEAIQAQRLEVAQVGAGEQGREAGRNGQLEAPRHHDTFDRPTALNMPVFICGGKYDGIAPVDNLEALERQIPNAHLEFFEGGHLFLREDRLAIHHVIAFFQGEQDIDDA